MPGQRVIVGGESNRWLNITRTRIIQGAEDPDSRIYICEVCSANNTNCNGANYTQLTVGTPPNITDDSGELHGYSTMVDSVVQKYWMGAWLFHTESPLPH